MKDLLISIAILAAGLILAPILIPLAIAAKLCGVDVGEKTRRECIGEKNIGI
jgi:hypothetical protein